MLWPLMLASSLQQHQKLFLSLLLCLLLLVLLLLFFSAPPRILHDNEDDYGTGIVLGMPPDVGCGLNSSSMESRSFFSKNPRLEPINETRESLDELPERQASSTTERSGRSSAPQSAL